MNKQRLDYIDILKGLGILMVIFSHSGAEEWLMSNMGDFFVPLFFIASGYTYKYHDESYLHQFSKRAVRLLKPYFFFSIVMLLLYQRFSIFDILGVFYSRYCLYPYHTIDNIFLMGGGNPPLWFLTSMLSAYIPFLFLMKNQEKANWILMFFTIYTFGCQYIPILLPWNLDNACLVAAFMYAGVVLRSDKSLLSRSDYTYILTLVFFFLVILFNGGDNLSVREYGRSFILYYLGCVFGAVFLLWLSIKIEKTPLRGLLVDFGHHSLVIFCSQMFLLRICHQVFHSMLHFPTEGIVFYMITLIKILSVAIVGMYISRGMNRYMPWLFK